MKGQWFVPHRARARHFFPPLKGAPDSIFQERLALCDYPGGLVDGFNFSDDEDHAVHLEKADWQTRGSGYAACKDCRRILEKEVL